jgi:hypothetical protein
MYVWRWTGVLDGGSGVSEIDDVVVVSALGWLTPRHEEGKKERRKEEKKEMEAVAHQPSVMLFHDANGS